MKKKIKDLTEQEALDICCECDACFLCPLRFHGGDYCVRKTNMDRFAENHPQIKDIIEGYLNKEVKLIDKEIELNGTFSEGVTTNG